MRKNVLKCFDLSGDVFGAHDGALELELVDGSEKIFKMGDVSTVK